MERGAIRRTGRRLEFLDGARGIAALLVVFHHAYQVAPFWPDATRLSPLRILLTGRPSVLFFYVLSGYVLSYGLWTSTRSDAPGLYAAKRVVRIYIPYVAATLVAGVLYLLMQPGAIPELGDTFNAMWSRPISWSAAFQHLFLAGTPQANSLNVPAWSLVYELRISIFMPLLCTLLVKAPLSTIGIAMVVFVGLLTSFARGPLGVTPYYAETFSGNATITLYFTTLFVAGAVLARGTIDAAPWITAFPANLRWALALAAMGLVLLNRDYAIVPGVVGLLYLCVTWVRAQRVLARPLLLLLGRVSFSLYLTHMIVIETVLRQTDGLVPLPVSVPLSVLLALFMAGLFYIGVERPAHILSKWVGRVAASREIARSLDPSRLPPTISLGPS